jgi:NADH dehydrogenase
MRFLGVVLSSMEQKIITIIGGTGFLGRYVVQELAKAGYRLRVVSRHPERASDLKVFGDVGQIALINGNINKPDSLKHALAGAYGVVNLVGVLFESGKQNFSAIHAIAAEKLAIAAREASVSRFVHISALGVEHEFGSAYARSKLIGERAVLEAFPNATILRPSVIFGAEDNFFNQFAKMAVYSPALPLIGGGKTLFQPVYVGDVARAVAACFEQPEACGEIYELGGRKTYSFKEILQYILKTTGRKRFLNPLPFWLASIIATFAEFLPKPPLTRDQVKLLKFDNIVSASAKNLSSLGIVPKSVEEIVPKYLAKFCKKKMV